MLVGYTGEDAATLWILDYFPSSRRWMAATHPPRAAILEELPGARLFAFEFEDMQDASLAALSANPDRVLEAAERGETSYFERMWRDHPEELQAGLARLREDIAAGRAPKRAGTATVCTWIKRYAATDVPSCGCARHPSSGHAAQKQLTLVAAVLGTSVVFLDATVTSVALPAIRGDLGGGLAGQQWVTNAYLLALGSLLLIGGSLGDVFGQKRVFLVGVAGFGLTSTLCAVASSIPELCVFRSMQGACAALVTPTTLAVIVTCFRRRAGQGDRDMDRA